MTTILVLIACALMATTISTIFAVSMFESFLNRR